MIKRAVLLLFAFLALVHTVASDCTASVTLVEATGQWQESHLPKRIFDLHITNTHTSCTINDNVGLSVAAPPGAKITSSWGMTSNKVSLSSLEAGQSYAGAGFVLSGTGTPTATVTSFGSCACTVDPTLGPQNPSTEAPTEAPTDAPTSPTETPATEAPTNAPTDTPTSTPTAAPTPSGEYYTLGLKFAFLTCNSTDIRLGVAKLALDSVGSQYDILNRESWGEGLLELTNSDGSGKYYAIVAATELACWNAAQQAQVAEYEIANYVKTVILYTYPYPSNGMGATAGVAIDDSTTTIQFAPAFESSTGALVYDAQIPVTGVYAYLASVSNSSLATPAVYINHDGTQYVAAAFINYPDGRRRLEFYLDQADWATFPVILGTAWLQWVTNGVFAGARRIEFNAHMDDIFMATGMFQTSAHGECDSEDDDCEIVRIAPEDLDKILAWQTNLNTAVLPTGSNFTLTFPYNGATVQEKGGFATDALYIKAKALRDHFVWESHTYEHPYLDNMTYEDVSDQYTDNVPTIKDLFDTDNLTTIPNYCKQSTITPSISGLFNGEALEAMWDFGIRFVVGDNSRKELIPSNLYHVLRSTEVPNGFAGMNIVPRHATNIYYDAARPEHIEEQFNYLYSATFNKNFTFDEIVQKDVQVATKALLSFRHDPFMFHQANLLFTTEEFDGASRSLLSYWADSVIADLEQYISLPVISHNHDHLGQMFLDRENRDNCGFQGTLKLDRGNHAVVGVNAKATNECVFGISGVQAEGDNVQQTETYGVETTAWLEMTPGCDFDVTFTNPILPL